MKITSIDVETIKVPLKEPFTIALGTIYDAASAVVKVNTDEGIYGYGEGSPAILVTGETMPGTIECIKEFEKALIGTDPTDLEKVNWILSRAAAPHAPCGKTAIDIACYDILGKKAGMPVYKLLGGNSNTIETDITIGIDTPEYMASKAKKFVAMGFDTIKTKVGTGAKEDIARVKAIREAVGDDVKIRLDANQGWNAKEAVQIIERLDEYDIELVEQPVPYHDITGLEYVTNHTNVFIMSDESCFNSKDALRLVERRAVDCLNIKLMKCGGLYEAQRINDICQAAGIECMLGCMGEESNIGITAAASLGAAKRNITRADLDATFSLSSLSFDGGVGLEVKKEIVLPEEPGFGFKGIIRK